MMKKRVIIILCIAVIMIAAVGIASSLGNQDKLPFFVKWEIEAAWPRELNREFQSWNDSGLTQGVRYYGKHNGYYVLFDDTGLSFMVLGKEVIADEVFEHHIPFRLYAYKNGEFLKLKDAYAQGLITEEQISIIAKKHREFKKQ